MAAAWLWAAAVLCAAWGARGEISHNMNTLSRHLQRDMADVMELAAVNYSEPVINTTYRASVEFDMRAMGPLYNSTHMVIDIIAHKQAYPEGDSGYPQRPWLMTPYLDPTQNFMDTFNAAHTSTRVVIENTFGRLKNRWRCVHRDRALHYQPEKCANIILACSVLHNIALQYNVPDPEDHNVVEEPQGIVSIEGGHLEVANLKEHWRPLLAHYAGPAALLVVAVLLAASLPLAGMFWCCCYWCRAGRRRRPFDRKYDACLKGMLAIIFIALLTLFLFGVVCLFATDAQAETGGAEAAGAVRAGVRDTREFLNATQAHARWLLVNNWRELADRLNAVLLTSGVMVSSKLGEFSRAVSVTTLNSLVLKLDDVQADLRRVRAHTDRLREHADTLNAGLRKVKNQLLQTLANCDQPKCLALQNKYNIGQLNTEIHYSQMPDVSELLNNVTALLDSNIKEEVGAGQQVFRDIQAGIRRSVQEHIPAVQQSIADTGARLEALADRITWAAGNASRDLQELPLADTLAHYHAEYGPYRRYLGLGAAVAPLLITCIFAWGLTCGVCGKRPDVYGASDCCNKGAGSKCLLCGVGLIFVLGGAMALVLAVYFAVGVAAQRFACDPLTEPRDNRLFADVEKFVDLERVMFNQRSDPDFNLTFVMLHCHANYTVYKTLQLHRVYDVGAARAQLAGAVAQRVAALRPAFPAGAGATILRRAAKDKLHQLADTGLSDFDFDKILHALESNMTSLALDALARQLDSTARSLARPTFAAEAESLARAAATLRALLHDVLTPMINYTQELNSTAIRLRDELRFNHKSLKEAIQYLMKETTEAEKFLNTQGPERLQNITQEYAAVITEKLNEYLDRVTHAAEHEVGRCGAISNAFNATRDAACNKILMPTNGYWIAMAWCVVLFVPLMVVAQRLARLYLHADPYPGPLVEAEYLYDAYADRDNVPLANAYKAEKRSGRARAREGEAPGAGGGERARAEPRLDVAPPLDAHHARRYNDMAPKHWEEGPPRYHGPTEYERPPPYYYPGPNDRQ